jgi:hypothetical protein
MQQCTMLLHNAADCQLACCTVTLQAHICPVSMLQAASRNTELLQRLLHPKEKGFIALEL